MLLSACIFESSSSKLTPQTLTFIDNNSAYLKIGETHDNPAIGMGSGQLSYQSSDESVAIVDSDGQVTALALGNATITATMLADDKFEEVAASYQLNVTFTVTAWVSEHNSHLSFPEGTRELEFYRSTDFDCDFTNYGACELGLMDILDGNSIIDSAANLNQKALYLFSEEDHSSTFSTSFPFENLPGREEHQVVSFKNKLWLLGGTDYESPLTAKSDIWSSQDGIHWTQESESLPYGELKEYKVIVFQNKIWIIGGYTSWESREDNKSIWSSADGVNWVEVTSEAPFGARYSSFQLTVFNQKLWLMGNREGVSEIWSSGDGVNWTAHSSELNTYPSFDQKVIAFNNKLWSLNDSGPSKREKIWSSNNGYDWKQETLEQELKFSSSTNGMAVINNKLLVFDDAYAWSSNDGINWVEERSGFDRHISVPNWSTTALYQGQLWVISAYEYNYQNKAWFSADGINWKQRKEDRSILERTGIQIAEFNEKLWLTGGYGSEELVNNDVWSSKDGINWEQEISSAAFTPRFRHKMYTFKNRFWILGGRYKEESGGWEDRNDIWSSVDGINWVEEANTLPFSSSNTYRYSITEFNEKLWLIDSYQNDSDNRFNDVWSSIDGVHWTLVVSSSGREFNNIQLVSFNNRMWVVGRGLEYLGSARYTIDGVWSTLDGIIWQLEDAYIPHLNVHDDYCFINNKGKLFYIFGDGYINEKDRVLSSDDGRNWSEESISGAVNFSTWEGVCTTFNDDIIVAGGLVAYKSGGGERSEIIRMSQPWKSSDGVNWSMGVQADIGLFKHN